MAPDAPDPSDRDPPAPGPSDRPPSAGPDAGAPADDTSSAGPPSPSPRIHALEPISGERMRLTLDDDTSLEIPAEVALATGLRVGDPVDPELRARLEDAHLRWRAREAALKLLSVRARSRRELQRRLRRKDFPTAVVRACLDELEARELLDDGAFARSLARDRIRLKARGPARIRRELRARGVADDTARSAIDGVMDDEGVTERELAEEAALGWLRRQPAEVAAALAGEPFSPERERARRRLTGYLGRRGFRGAAAVAAMEAASAQAADG